MARHGSLLADDPAEYDAVDGFVLLGTGDWNRARQDLLLASLRAQPRPVLVGNPNLVSPREDGLAPEPGLYAHEIADLTVSVWPDRPLVNQVLAVGCAIGAQFQGSSSSTRLIL